MFSVFQKWPVWSFIGENFENCSLKMQNKIWQKIFLIFFENCSLKMQEKSIFGKIDGVTKTI